MRKYILLTLLIISLLISSGCSYVAYKDYYTNPSEYNEIWALTGLNYIFEDDAHIFPTSISNLDIEEFYCRYDQQLPLGEGIQIFLHIKYDKEAYDREVSRIKSFSVECDELFNETELSFNAKTVCENGVSEYVAFDTQNLSVYYIYLQYMPKDEIEFEHQFLPDNYSGYGELT